MYHFFLFFQHRIRGRASTCQHVNPRPGRLPPPKKKPPSLSVRQAPSRQVGRPEAFLIYSFERTGGGGGGGGLCEYRIINY
jgi:hypothetical protein